MADRDYYQILGVGRDASEDDINQAFRKLAKQYHPDVTTETDKKRAEDKFKEANEAHGVLIDAEKRARYDRFGEAGLKQGFVPPEGGRNTGGGANQQGGRDFWGQGGVGGDIFGDFFESWFGMNAQERAAARQRAEEKLKDLEAKKSRAQGQGEGRVHQAQGQTHSNPQPKPVDPQRDIKFGLIEVEVPNEEFGLLAGLMKAEKNNGALTIEHGNYRVKKDGAGNTRVEVKLSRFIKDGRTEVVIGKPGTFESFKKTNKDWVDASWIDQMNVVGADLPKNYRSLVGMINQVALVVAHGGKLTDELITGLNIAARVSFPDDHKREIAGDRLREELVTEARKWVPTGIKDEVKQGNVPPREGFVPKKPAAGEVDFGKILSHRKRT